MAVLTTTVGSFPKPIALRHARRKFEYGDIDADGLRAAEAAALCTVLDRQRELGIDVLVDGQMDRSDMLTFFAENCGGLEVGGWVRALGNCYYRRPVVVGEVERPGPLTVDSWKRASEAADGNVKAVLTGPYTLMDWSFDEHYATREACCMAFAELLRDEVRDLVAAGATEIQLDEPAISGRAHEMPFLAAAIARVFDGAGEGVRKWLWAAYGELQPVLGNLFELPIDILSLELTNSRFALVDALKDLPEDKFLGAGVVDALDPGVESIDTIRERIDRVRAVVPEDRLFVHPDGGLRTLTIEQADAKLAALAAAAQD